MYVSTMYPLELAYILIFTVCFYIHMVMSLFISVSIIRSAFLVVLKLAKLAFVTVGYAIVGVVAGAVTSSGTATTGSNGGSEGSSPSGNFFLYVYIFCFIYLFIHSFLELLAAYM